MLQYAPDTDRLFFTTTLQNAVQAYSVNHSKLLGPFCHHPSPPTVLAVSLHSRWLLSASAAPPTILLTNLLLTTPNVSIHPRCSSSAVVAADFHPSRTNILLLAFADGACALYDVAYLVRVDDEGGHRPNPAGFRTGGEISYITRLHATVSSIPAVGSELGLPSSGMEYSKNGVGETGIGITAVAFVPGSRAKAVTIGADGTCCVVDFGTEGQKKGSVLRSWHIQGPATSLALLSSTTKTIADDIEEVSVKGPIHPRRRVLVAIGRQDGKVVLFDLGGHLFQDYLIGLDGSKIILLEWTPNTAGRSAIRQSTPPGLAAGAVPPLKQRRKSAVVSHAPGGPIAKAVPIIDGVDAKPAVSPPDASSHRESVEEPFRPPYSAVTASNQLDCFDVTRNNLYGEDQKAPSSSHGPNTGKVNDSGPDTAKINDSGRIRGRLDSRYQAGADGASSSRPMPIKVDQVPLLPPFSPRPKVRKSGEPLRSRAEKRQQASGGACVNPRPDKQRSLSRNATALKRTARLSRIGSDVTARDHAATKHGQDAGRFPSDEEETVPTTPSNDDDWTDVATSSRRPIRRFHGRPVKFKKREDLRASSALPPRTSFVSEAPNDIVVEWTPASSQLAPTSSLLPYDLPEIPPRVKPRGKTRAMSVASNDTIVQWSSFKKGHVFAMRNNDRSSLKSQRLSARASSKTPLNTKPAKQEPLAETTSHNPKGPLVFTRPPSPPSRAPPPPPPKSTESNDQQSGDAGPLQVQIRRLRDEISAHFLAQKTWFDGKLEDLNEAVVRIEAENQRLAKELLLDKVKSKEKGK